MRNISTFFYLVDTITLPSESLLFENKLQPAADELLSVFFDYIEVDPGPDMVMRTIERMIDTD